MLPEDIDTPHAFVPCASAHMFPFVPEEHCADCHRAKDHEIHADVEKVAA